jgi:hypothetical protein
LKQRGTRRSAKEHGVLSKEELVPQLGNYDLHFHGDGGQRTTLSRLKLRSGNNPEGKNIPMDVENRSTLAVDW